jgi:hypothetical protein
LLAYNGLELNKKEDLKLVAKGDKPIVVDTWRDGRSSRRQLPPGELGVVIDPRPAPVAITGPRLYWWVIRTDIRRSGSKA